MQTEEDMRTVNEALVREYADLIRPHLALARRAVGVQAPDSPARQASDTVNAHIREYMDERGGNMTHLATELEGHISLPGLRRRLRASRGRTLGNFSTSRQRGSTDPERVQAAAEKISAARAVGKTAYRNAVREVYADNVSLSAIAEHPLVKSSYYSLWSAGTAG